VGSEGQDAEARVVMRDDPLTWDEDPRPEGDDNPPGFETVLFRSGNGDFSCGFWRRVPESGILAPPFDEIMCFLDGEVEVTREDGTTLRVGPGDILCAPNGSSARWHSLTPVFKFWAVHHGSAGEAEVTATHGAGPLAWSESSVPADDGFALGREITAFAAGRFSTGLWEREEFDRDFHRDYDEVALIISGEADITTELGRQLHAGPGDVFITPKGSRGHWRSRSPLRKFWAVYESSPES
jgi:uncharacterized cupin superfamily protein